MMYEMSSNKQSSWSTVFIKLWEIYINFAIPFSHLNLFLWNLLAKWTETW